MLHFSGLVVGQWCFQVVCHWPCYQVPGDLSARLGHCGGADLLLVVALADWYGVCSLKHVAKCLPFRWGRNLGARDVSLFFYHEWYDQLLSAALPSPGCRIDDYSQITRQLGVLSCNLRVWRVWRVSHYPLFVVSATLFVLGLQLSWALALQPIIMG